MKKKIFWITLVLYVSGSSMYRYTDLFKDDETKTTVAATKMEVKTKDELESLKMKAIKLKEKAFNLVKHGIRKENDSISDKKLPVIEDLSIDEIVDIYKYVDDFMDDNCDNTPNYEIDEIDDVLKCANDNDDTINEFSKKIINDLDEIVPGFKNIVLNTKHSEGYTEIFGTHEALSLEEKLKLNLATVRRTLSHDYDTWERRLLINVIILLIPAIFLIVGVHEEEDYNKKNIIHESIFYTLLISTIIYGSFDYSVYGIFDLSRWFFDLGLLLFFIVKFNNHEAFQKAAVIFGGIVVAGQVLNHMGKDK